MYLASNRTGDKGETRQSVLKKSKVVIGENCFAKKNDFDIPSIIEKASKGQIAQYRQKWAVNKGQFTLFRL
jgi:homogentisate 1,2-dioxygenase